jgi:hypothetical protein
MGGAVHMQGNSQSPAMTFASCTFSENYARITTTGSNRFLSLNGGAIYASLGGKYVFTSTTFSGNYLRGGWVFLFIMMMIMMMMMMMMMMMFRGGCLYSGWMFSFLGGCSYSCLVFLSSASGTAWRTATLVPTEVASYRVCDVGHSRGRRILMLNSAYIRPL